MRWSKIGRRVPGMIQCVGKFSNRLRLIFTLVKFLRIIFQNYFLLALRARSWWITGHGQNLVFLSFQGHNVDFFDISRRSVYVLVRSLRSLSRWWCCAFI